MKRKVNPETPILPTATGGGRGVSPITPNGMASEDAKILRESLPKEEVTRDFLQELLEEHRAGRKGR